MQAIESTFVRDTIQLTPGRALWAVEKIGAKLRPDERGVLGARLEAAKQAATEAVRVASMRRRLTDKTYGDDAREHDAGVDAVLAGIDGLLGALARVHDAGSELGARVRMLREAFFPRGLAAVVNAPYAEELAQLHRMLALAAEPAMATAVRGVPGLAELIEVLDARTRTFDAALERQSRTAPSYREARAAAAAADRRTLELVMGILFHLGGDGPEETARRSTLLAPYVTQLENQRERMRRRVATEDVDPTIGEIASADEAVQPTV